MQRKSMGGGLFSKGDLPLLSCLAGNDYIDRLYLNGHKKVLQLMQQFLCLEKVIIEFWGVGTSDFNLLQEDE